MAESADARAARIRQTIANGGEAYIPLRNDPDRARRNAKIFHAAGRALDARRAELDAERAALIADGVPEAALVVPMEVTPLSVRSAGQTLPTAGRRPRP